MININSNRFILIFTILIFVVLTSYSNRQGKSITLSAKTISSYSIVLYDHNSVIQQFAAKELQYYLKLLYGVKIEIINKEIVNYDKTYFYLGEGFCHNFFSDSGFARKDAFVKAFLKGNIFLGGKDDLYAKSVKNHFLINASNANFGTLNAVYDFLEYDLGIHWFFPSKVGEFVPEIESIELDENVCYKKPDFEERAFGIKHLHNNRDTAIFWLLRNRVGISKVKLYNHSWYKLLPPEEYFDKYPDFYAEIHGKRMNFSSKQPQLCTTNKEMVTLLVDKIRNEIKKGQIDYLSLSPNDNNKFCECLDCIELDNKGKTNLPHSDMSYRVYSFYQQIFDFVWNNHLGIEIGGFAYDQYSQPPDSLFLSNGFHVRIVSNGISFFNSYNLKLDSLESLLGRWSQKHTNIGFYSFPTGGRWPYPIVNANCYLTLINILYQKDISKIRLSFTPDWYAQGFDMWLISKVLWDSKINIDSLKRVYYSSLYPNTEMVVKAFHNNLQSITDSILLHNEKEISNNELFRDRFLSIYNEKFLSEHISNFCKALKIDNLDEKETQNLNNILLMLKWVKMEYLAFSKYEDRHLLPNDDERNRFEKILDQIKTNNCVPVKSKYFNPNSSPSVFINLSY